MYENLRKTRKDARRTLDEMRELLNLKTKTAYLKKETGAVKTTVDEAIILENYFKKPVKYLFAK